MIHLVFDLPAVTTGIPYVRTYIYLGACLLEKVLKLYILLLSHRLNPNESLYIMFFSFASCFYLQMNLLILDQTSGNVDALHYKGSIYTLLLIVPSHVIAIQV